MTTRPLAADFRDLDKLGPSTKLREKAARTSRAHLEGEALWKAKR
jgi:hypothetical protein